MINYFKNLFCWFLCVQTCIAFSQSISTDVNVIGPSPNAASISKFVDLPISYYTGTPDVSLPIFTLKTQQLEVPVSLSYHASGLKVEEHASWVGAGWSLNAGGVISRTVRGLPDEFYDDPRKGYYHAHSVVASNGNIIGDALQDCSVTNVVTSQTPVNTPDSISWGLLDTEPDYYVLSAPGIESKFFINKLGSIIPFEATDLNFVTYPFSNPAQIPTHSGPTYTWEIQSEDGTIYKFSSHERTITSSVCSGGRSMYDDHVSYQSSWYLDEISIGDEWIRFEYESEAISYPASVSESRKFKILGSGAQTVISDCTNNNYVTVKRIKRIYSSNGYEVFFEVPAGYRSDLDGSKKLEKITIKYNGNFLSAYNTEHTYFGDNAKLKLDRIVQVDETGVNELNQGQQFEYFSSHAVPPIYSRSQDYWGYYNGSTQSSLIPVYKDDTYHFNKGSSVSRNPNLASCKIGSLSKIIYPTGGYTEFEYELHSYYDANRKQDFFYQATSQNEGLATTIFQINVACSATITKDPLSQEDGPLGYTNLKKWNGSTYVNFVPSGASGYYSNRVTFPAGQYRLEAYSETSDHKFINVEFEQVVPGQIDVGGLRIKRMKHFDPLNSKSIIKRFEYIDEVTGNSSGVIFRPPALGTYMSTNKPGEMTGAFGTLCVTTAILDYWNVSSYSQVPLVVYSGSHIGYSTVKEYSTDESGLNANGYSIYQFINERDNTPKTFPIIPDIDYGYKNGQPLSTKVYKILPNGTPKIIQGTYYQYTESSITGSSIWAVNFKENTSGFCYECNTNKFSSNYYGITTKWHRVITETQVSSDDSGNETSIVSTYTYDQQGNHYFHIKEDTQQNPGELYSEELERHTTFPSLIKKSETFFNGSKISGTKTDYVNTQPIFIETWNSKSNAYLRTKDFTYDSWRLIREQSYLPGAGNSGVRSYLWGYNNNLPVAEIFNANPDQCSYTSFEDDLTNISTTEKKAGNKSHIGPLSVTMPGSGTYLISYWKKSGTEGWKYYEAESSTTFITGISGDFFDEVRVMPKTARMKTYLYFPNGLLRSTGDENGRITYYEYDSFGRLNYVMDNEKNILKRYQYNYKN